MRYSKDPEQIGTKLGPKLVALISQTIAATKLKLLDTEHRARVISMQEIIDRAGREIADLQRPIIKQVLADADLPDEVRQYIERTISGTHQWHSIAGTLIMSTGVGGPISNIVNNFLAPGVRKAISFDPQLAPTPEEMAGMTAKGTFDRAKTYDLSGGAGYSSDIVDGLLNAAYSYPDLDTALQLLRRKLVSDGDVGTYLTRNGIPASVQGHLIALQRQLLTPADLADMVVRGIKTQSEAADVASQWGIVPADFGALVEDTGEPLALMQLLEAFRRGFIDEARLVRGILQSRVKDEWVDVAEKLRFSPMSVADAVNATVQNHMDAATANTIAEQNGLEPGQVNILLETAGEPLSRTEMEDLYNRGEASQDEVDQALRESRLKDKYVTQAFQLHRKIIPIFTLERALRYGGITHEDAVRIAMESGYSQADSNIIVESGSGQRTQTYKDKTVSAVESMYESNLIPEGDAASLISGMGYSQEESSFILKAAEFRRQAHAVTQVVNAVRSKYLAHRITQHEASGFLDAAGIPAPQRDYNIALWNIERDANVRTLTEAQVVKAVKLKLISADEGNARLVAMGYTSDDAALLLAGA